MLEYLKIENVGPAAQLELEFAPRLNLITGDNGLGKTFLLDIAWFATVGSWPAELNPSMTTGRMALPLSNARSLIAYRHSGLNSRREPMSGVYQFHRPAFVWMEGIPRREDPPNSLLLYAQVDGSYSVWDPARNVEQGLHNSSYPKPYQRPAAYVFSPTEAWNGLRHSDGTQFCNGLIADWAIWQKEKGKSFERLSDLLIQLSPDTENQLAPGELTRVSPNDSRDIPTLKSSVGQEVPIVFASAAIRRILALAYLLVWTWDEHLRACKLLDLTPASSVTFLIDEIEAHLHPSWQRSILRSILAMVGHLSSGVSVQLIAATHSPLVMASAEPWFDPKLDAWFDLDLSRENGTSHVTLIKRDFEPQGEASDWLRSEAFDLGGAGSLERQRALEKASLTLSNEQTSPQEARDIHEGLRRLLPESDPFWMRWRHIGEKRGWWP